MSPSSLLAAIAALQARLQQDRLCLAQDRPGALHYLRVDLRQLRSLLKPLDDYDVFAELAATAQALAEKSGPARDAEVLLDELMPWQPALAEKRLDTLRQMRADLVHSGEVATFFSVMANFLALVSWHDLPDEASIARSFRQAGRRWKKQIAAAMPLLPELLQDTASAPDGQNDLHRHELRLLIKRLRYTLAWQGTPGQGPLVRALKQAQARIGEWHDRCNWITAAAGDPSLAPLAAIWHSELQFHADSADAALRRLGKILKDKHG